MGGNGCGKIQRSLYVWRVEVENLHGGLDHRCHHISTQMVGIGKS